MIKKITIIAFIAGSLDIIAAFIQAYITNKILPATVLQYIASGALGTKAFSGGVSVVFLGLLFHFVIAFACTAIFFAVYNRIAFLKKNVGLNALLIALIAWIVTNLIIIPFSKITPQPFEALQTFVAILILFVCVGLPIAYFAKKYFGRN